MDPDYLDLGQSVFVRRCRPVPTVMDEEPAVRQDLDLNRWSLRERDPAPAVDVGPVHVMHGKQQSVQADDHAVSHRLSAGLDRASFSARSLASDMTRLSEALQSLREDLDRHLPIYKIMPYVIEEMW